MDLICEGDVNTCKISAKFVFFFMVQVNILANLKEIKEVWLYDELLIWMVLYINDRALQEVMRETNMTVQVRGGVFAGEGHPPVLSPTGFATSRQSY